MRKIDYLFETSWEICNKVGGIYTVLSTKALTAVNHYKNNYICIGPELSREAVTHSDFVEDATLYKSWREAIAKEGIRIRIGRWRVVGNPIVILVDFTHFFEKKNEILTDFWLSYQLDSISGQWDYIEPVLFGYAAGKVIESFYHFHCTAHDRIVAHFHEWMTGSGILYLKDRTPQVATVFTSHATVLGRCIAGNGLPLYSNLQSYNPQETAQRFGVQSKYSLESLSAQKADAYSAVSEITAMECQAFFQKPVDEVTINGFENNFVPQGETYVSKRQVAREKIRSVATALFQQPISHDAFLVLSSGRYEYRNKGIDVYLKALSEMSSQNPDREVLAVVAVPAAVSGQKVDLVHRLENATDLQHNSMPLLNDCATHALHDPYNDMILRELNALNLQNAPDQKVKVLFVPVYLNGHDGIFNLDYYDFLIGFDLTIFPSYYEPWGYTPLESVAFGVPTITTTLAGFGQWVKGSFPDNRSVTVVPRTDDHDDDTCRYIVDALKFYLQATPAEQASLSSDAQALAAQALWTNLFDNYQKLYEKALEKSELRYELFKNKVSHINILSSQASVSQPVWKRITIKSNLEGALEKLELLAQNLWWSWNYEARDLFIEIAGEEQWRTFEENPVHLLQMLPRTTIQTYSENKDFVERLNRVYDDFQAYMAKGSEKKGKKIAYFSMEFGISNELKIFSGGLGMLAGDYLKEASDCNANMVAVGLLYRCGYFMQQISPTGEQINRYPMQRFSKLPIHPVRTETGDWCTISIALPGRSLSARLWRVDVGRVKLYLLDTDVDQNLPEDRAITYSLYGGDIENRLKQELLLGVGGVRLLNLLGENPEIYHLNEGHAAFLSLERVTNLMQQQQLPFASALEMVKASSLFTTHTPVPAGHDAFTEDLMRTYFAHYPEKFNISWEQFMALGRKDESCLHDKFSMSLLACRFSQEVNGVSRIHGRVTREMFAYLYDGRFPEELPIGYVTNGVHYPTWAHKRWQQFHRTIMGQDYKADISNPDHWAKMAAASDDQIWAIKSALRKELIDHVKVVLEVQMRNRNDSPALIVDTIKALRDDVLTVGFARRFATYKRAHLLFTNEEKLSKMVNNPDHPMQFIFAGKAHPHDKAGQDLIKRIIEVSRKPEFIGKIIFIENYDMILAKKLVSGCDVWLNTPTRPMEASGTSGEKAVMNGVLNFSVLDGWWAEGYTPDAGWAVDEQITYADNHKQDELDVANIFFTFKEQIIPAFYERKDDLPTRWITMMKNNFMKISPHFTMKRQLDDYYHKFYAKLMESATRLSEDRYKNLFRLVQWKSKMMAAWDNIEEVSQDIPAYPDSTFYLGENRAITLEVKLGSIDPEDVKVELLLTRPEGSSQHFFAKYALTYQDTVEGVSRFVCQFDAQTAGVWSCAIRMIPNSPWLAYDTDLNLVKWF